MSSRVSLRIGYLVPEFPGQTHIFFWREREALRRLGLEVDLVSTRRPPAAIVSHEWSAEAMAETEYLFPVLPMQLPDLVRGIIRARAGGRGRVVASIGRAATGVLGRVRLATLALLGARLAVVASRRGWRHIHVHSCADAAHIALFAHLLGGIRYSLTLHGPLGDYGPNQPEKWRHAAFGVVITQRLLAEVRDRLRDDLPAVVEVAPMGVDVERFRPPDQRSREAGGASLNVFSCGRLNPCKDHESLIAAVALLRDRGLDARLVIAGEDEAGGTTHRRVVEKLIGGLGMGPHVSLLGAVSEGRIIQELGRADVFSLASIAEPLGVAIMEAMAMALPVVVTRTGGVPELVDDGVDGILVPARDTEALANGIEKVARDPDLAARLGRAARQKVLARFRSTRSAERLALRIADSVASGDDGARGHAV